MARKTVFLKEQNVFGTEIDYTLTFSDSKDTDAFLNLCDTETLKRLLEKQIDTENFEMAEIISQKLKIKS